MDSNVARRIACARHEGQHTRFGDSVVEHLRHVAGAVAPEARAVAWLHDLFELTPVSTDLLRARGLTAVEERALHLLTRHPAEPYTDHVLRIARAPGRAGSIARTVKLADLDDHLAHASIPAGAPPYAWARDCVLAYAGLPSTTALVS